MFCFQQQFLHSSKRCGYESSLKSPIEFKPTFFENMYLLSIETKISGINIKSLAFLRFQMSDFLAKTVNLSLVFTESQHLVKFSSIIKVLSHRTKKLDLYTY